MMNNSLKMMPAQLFDFGGKPKAALTAQSENKSTVQMLTTAILNAADMITSKPVKREGSRVGNPAIRNTANIAARRSAKKHGVISGYAAAYGHSRGAADGFNNRRCCKCGLVCCRLTPRNSAFKRR